MSHDCDPKIPRVAQELMKKMIRQFAKEYASKCQPPTSTNGVARPSSPLSETSDAPLDLRVKGTSEEREGAPEPETGVKSSWKPKYLEKIENRIYTNLKP